MKNTYFFVFLSLIALVAPNLAHCAGNNLTASENKYLIDCEYNINNPQLLEPRIAAYCQQRLQDGLYAKLVVSEPIRARKLMADTGLLTELGRQVSFHGYTVGALTQHLSRLNLSVLELDETEKFVSWTKKYFPESLNAVMDGVRDYEKLGQERKALLAGDSITREKYQSMPFQKRILYFFKRARANADEMLKAREEPKGAELKNVLARAGLLYRDLDEDRASELGKRMQQLLIAQRLTDPVLAEAFAREYGYLLPKVYNSVWQGSLSEAEAAKLAGLLKPAIMKELSNTEAGELVLRYYGEMEEKQIQVPEFICSEKLNSANAYYASDHNWISVNSELIENWLKSKNYAPADMFVSQIKLAELVEYLAPLFVHESVHAKQYLWIDSNKLPDFYLKDKEIESHSLQSLFILQTAKRSDTQYLDRLIPEHKKRAEDFKKYGINAFLERVNNDYPSRAAFGAQTAQEFGTATFGSSLLKKRAVNMESDSAGEAAADAQRYTWGEYLSDRKIRLEQVKTLDLSEHLKEIDRWYQLYRHHYLDDLTEIQNQLERL